MWRRLQRDGVTYVVGIREYDGAIDAFAGRTSQLKLVYVNSELKLWRVVGEVTAQ